MRKLIEFRSLLDDYEELKEDAKESIITRMFKKILKSSAKISFMANIKSLEESEKDTYEGVKDAIKATSKEILGNDAYDNQVEYLKKTKKPRKMSVDEWLKKVQNINFALPYIDMDEEKLSTKELIKEVVLPNVPTIVKLSVKT